MAEITKGTGRGRKKPAALPADLAGRIQPQARELEVAVLGALMLEKDAYSIVSEILKPECYCGSGCQPAAGRYVDCDRAIASSGRT